VEVNDTVGVAVRGRGLTYFLVQEYSGPPRGARSEVGIQVVSSAHSIRIDTQTGARKSGGRQDCREETGESSGAAGITLNVFVPQGIHA
jgi:hypothetical protein